MSKELGWARSAHEAMRNEIQDITISVNGKKVVLPTVECQGRFTGRIIKAFAGISERCQLCRSSVDQHNSDELIPDDAEYDPKNGQDFYTVPITING